MQAGKSSGMIVGPVSTEPTYSETQKGTSVLTVVIRVDNGYTTKDGTKVERIEDVPIKFIGNTALHARDLELRYNDVVVVTFHASGREYKDKFYCEIVGDGIEKLSQIATSSQATYDTTGDIATATGVPVEEDSDLPF